HAPRLSTLFPYTTLFRSLLADGDLALASGARYQIMDMVNWWLRETTPVGDMAKQIKWDEFRRTDANPLSNALDPGFVFGTSVARSEEHTSELQSPDHLVC